MGEGRGRGKETERKRWGRKRREGDKGEIEEGKRRGREKERNEGNRKRRRKRKRRTKQEEQVFMLFNPRGLVPKEALVKQKMARRGVLAACFPESQTFKEGGLDDRTWQWEAGRENRPSWHDKFPPGGMGMLTHKQKCKASPVERGKYAMWQRLERKGGTPLFLCVAYYPRSSDIAGHREANKEVAAKVREYARMGEVIFMGDCNAHTGANGDKTPRDTAGRLLEQMLEDVRLTMVNKLESKCKSKLTRVEVKSNGTQETTIDYVAVSDGILPHIIELRIEDDQMGSDHKPLILRLRDLRMRGSEPEGIREVWRLEDIPCPRKDMSFVRACQAAFVGWAEDSRGYIEAMEAVGADTDRVADVLDWSFQRELDRVAMECIGKKKVGPRPTAMLDRANVLMEDPRSTAEERRIGREQFLAARRQQMSAMRKQKRLLELAVFRQVEEHQSDSKLFWSKVRSLRGSIGGAGKPPPIAQRAERDGNGS
jgi:hypothetical protein